MALVRNSFHDHMIRTTASSGDKHVTDSPFVRFLCAYQHVLPDACQRYKKVPSLAKGIQIANRKYEGIDSDYLSGLLFGYLLGVDPKPYRVSPADFSKKVAAAKAKRQAAKAKRQAARAKGQKAGKKIRQKLIV